MTSPSTAPAIKVLISQMALTVGTLIGCKTMRFKLRAIASVVETIVPVGSNLTTYEATFVGASRALRSQSMDFMTEIELVCAINV